jgi:acetylornithine deacetylase
MPKMSEIEKTVADAVAGATDELVALVRDLVRIPTENIPPGGQELAGQLFLQRWLGERGIDSELIDLAQVNGLTEHELFHRGEDYERRDYEGRPNLAARLKGTGGGRTLIFSCHMDTIAGDKAQWQRDPFEARIEGNHLYGQGAFDMKGGMAAQAMAFMVLREMDVSLAGDIIFETVVDEEHAGCNGTLANRVAGFNGDAAILPEPSSLQVYSAFKGSRIIHLTLKGKSGMSFAGEELVNPVDHIGLLIEGVKRFRDVRRKKIPRVVEYEDDPDPVPIFMNKLQAGAFNLDVPMAIPEQCTVELYIQTMPGETHEEIDSQLLEYLDGFVAQTPELQQFELKHRIRQRWLPGGLVAPDSLVVQVLEETTGQVLGRSAKATGAPFPCDAFVFHHFGIPAVVLGPCGAGCHGPDEYVEIDSLVQLAKIMAVTAVRFCGSS